MPDAPAVRNIDVVNRALLQAGEEFHKEKRTRLKLYAVPVLQDAESLAKGRIRNIGREWGEMRIGVTPDMVYVAPVERGQKFGNRKRVKFAALLMGTAMIPALEANRRSIGERIDVLVERMTRRFNRG